MPELTIQQAIELAIRHQSGGRLAEAEAIYRQILVANPNHPDALHLLGAVAFQAGQPDKAVELIRRAIEVHRANPDYHANLAKALIACGKSSEALDAYAKSLQLRPKSSETWNAIGDLFDTLGESNQAIAAFQLALNLQPNFADAWNNLGIALQKTGQTDAAIDAFRKAVAAQPQFLHAHFNLGMVLHAAGRPDEASAALQQAASLRPESADVFNALGVSLRAAGQLHQAMDAFEDAIQLQPQLAEAWSNLGSALQADGKLIEAISSYRRAVSIRPDFADALRNLGLALQETGELDEAIVAHEKAVAVDPNFAAGFNSLGSALHASGNYDQAIVAFARAIALRPDFAMAHHNLGLTLLLNGDFPRGWPEHEWRLADPALSVGTLKLDKPKWDGSDPSGRRILLHPEQGFGDAIQFIRYACLVHQRGARVIVASRPETRRLFEAVACIDQIVDFGGPLPEFDVHCPLMSLPMMLATTLQSIPADIPYLKADPEVSSRWRERIRREHMNVGIAWAGKSAHRNDRNRSLDPQVLDSILSTPGFNFVSLQKDQTVKSLTDWTSELRDFAETAGIIDNLDLVITVDTAVAHLAGAMGRAVWVLLPFVPDWRWLLNRDDSPWYPTMRLFRQQQLADWNAPIKRIVEELTSLKIPSSHG